MKMPYHSIRGQYTKGRLNESQVQENPLRQLDLWLTDAIAADLEDPTAMVLSTAGQDLRPSSRVVLMKDLDERGISFFSNYESRKGIQLEANPQASLLFFWPALERQVRIEGRVLKLSEDESDAYFASRPHASRISATISPQSREIPGREWLENRQRAKGEEIKKAGLICYRPTSWGGYRLEPDYVEFWQGREDRLHDRIAFSRNADGWRIFRLAP